GMALAAGHPNAPTVGQEANQLNTQGSTEAGTSNQATNESSKPATDEGTNQATAETKKGHGTAGAMAAAKENESHANQSAGVTSGPSAGSNVAPNTAVAKQGSQETMAEANTNGTSTTHTAGKASMGVGAPGTPAHPGTEAGKAPAQKSAQQ
ncbi:MAG TPA: hypothetical protein VLI93_13115, partial [Acetobacteraceae bacterium]|nr:hypothetical protein [Acetobacteraceae bacterium]